MRCFVCGSGFESVMVCPLRGEGCVCAIVCSRSVAVVLIVLLYQVYTVVLIVVVEVVCCSSGRSSSIPGGHSK